MLELAVSCYG